MKTFIISTRVFQHLAEKIKKKRDDFKVVLPAENKKRERHFPDGKIYIKIK